MSADRATRDPYTVAVVGGGLAGLAAAVRLAERGRRVLLLESRPQLGGATASFTRPGHGDQPDLCVDTGQHVSLRCYTAYSAFLQRLGTADQVEVQGRFDLPVLLPGRRITHLRRSRLPAPLHLAAALAGFSALGPRERAGVAAAALRLGRLDPEDPRLDEQTFGEWLRANHQTERAVQRLWGLVIVAALNIDPDQASLALAARVLRTGLLDERAAGDIGIPRVPLGELHGRPAARVLDRLGAVVRTCERVRGIDIVAGAGFCVRTSDGEAAVDQVVLAAPHPQATALVPAGAYPQAEQWSDLGASPIINVHMVLDRRVADLPFAAAPASTVQWLFDKTTVAGLGRGQYLVTSVSDAGSRIGARAETLCLEQAAELARLLPRFAQARILDAFVTREPRATFRQRAGTARVRPAPTGRLPGLVLAGAWTRTGWPDTMEGAVRSGNTAADLLTLGSSTRPTLSAHSLQPDTVLPDTLQEAQ